MKVTKELLKKYSKGKCTNAEKTEVELWLLSKEDDVNVTEIDFSNSIENIKQKLDTTLFKKKKYLRVQMLRYAAVAAILLTVGLSSYSIINSSFLLNNKQTVAFEDLKTIKTLKGERKKVTLPDGSIVHLNYDSKIKIPEKFGKERVVHLSGQAYFDVVRNPDKPFIIHTNQTKTKVLGTSFDIKAFPNVDQTNIVVTSGIVEFTDKKNTENKAILTVNKKAVISKNKSILVTNIDAKSMVGWMDNKMLFQDMPFKDIVLELERWFNVDIELLLDDNTILNKPFVYANAEPNIKNVMESLSFIVGFQYEITQNKVIIQ